MTLTFFILGTACLLVVELLVSWGFFVLMGKQFRLIADILGVVLILASGWLLKFVGLSGTIICQANAVPDNVAQYGLTLDTPGCVNHFTYFTNLGGLTETTFGFDPFLAAVVTYAVIELAHKVYRRIF